MTRAALAIALALLAAAAPARAQTAAVHDQRPVDRWFFSQYTGVSFSTVNGLSRTVDKSPVTSSGGASDSGLGWSIGLSQTYWPCDYFGIGFDLALFNFSFPQPKNAALDFGAYAVRVGTSARVAVPLRYLQPYVGIMPSIMMVSSMGAPDQATNDALGGASGAGFNLVYLFGSNFYVTRNVRLLAEYQLSFFDGAVVNFTYPSGAPAQTHRVSYDGAATHLVFVGAAWSPESMHAMPNRMKKWVLGVMPLLMVCLAAAFAGLSAVRN